MLRNSLIPHRIILSIKCELHQGAQRYLICTDAVHRAKNVNLNRQGKIMGKLFGNRVAGSKKHWYPVQDSSGNSQSGLFKASQFGKPPGSGSGKSNTRRMTVLNKLFMKHITDLLATGEASEAILGRGLQVTRVKITSDFGGVNVFWLGSGDLLSDVQLEKDLRSCSGVLRHELSQLALMGEVPRIQFVREKIHVNLNEVEARLRDLNIEPEESDKEQSEGEGNEECVQPRLVYDAASSVRNEFFGKDMPSPEDSIRYEQEFPRMRHDVFGLDHENIMNKILTKMRKSKQAWVQHRQSGSSDEFKANAADADICEETVEQQRQRLHEKLTAAAANSEKFDKFLAKRSERRNTPERKKFRKSDHLIDLNPSGTSEDEPVLSRHQRQLMQEEDYIHEDVANYDKSRT